MRDERQMQNEGRGGGRGGGRLLTPHAPRPIGHARPVPQLKPLTGFALRAGCPGRQSTRSGTVCRAEVATRRQNLPAEKDLRPRKSAKKSFLSKTVSRTKPPEEGMKDEG